MRVVPEHGKRIRCFELVPLVESEQWLWVVPAVEEESVSRRCDLGRTAVPIVEFLGEAVVVDMEQGGIPEGWTGSQHAVGAPRGSEEGGAELRVGLRSEVPAHSPSVRHATGFYARRGWARDEA